MTADSLQPNQSLDRGVQNASVNVLENSRIDGELAASGEGVADRTSARISGWMDPRICLRPRFLVPCLQART